MTQTRLRDSTLKSWGRLGVGVGLGTIRGRFEHDPGSTFGWARDQFAIDLGSSLDRHGVDSGLTRGRFGRGLVDPGSTLGWCGATRAMFSMTIMVVRIGMATTIIATMLIMSVSIDMVLRTVKLPNIVKVD